MSPRKREKNLENNSVSWIEKMIVQSMICKYPILNVINLNILKIFETRSVVNDKPKPLAQLI